MSYCSDVRFRLTKDDYQKLEQEYLKQFGKDEHYKDFWVKKDIYEEENNTIYFGWNDTKWYYSVKDEYFAYCQFIMEFITQLDTYCYAIIGADVDDIDFDWNGEIEPIEIVRGFADDRQETN